MKKISYLILGLGLLLNNIEGSFASGCTQGMVFNRTLNRCVLSKKTVETKSDAMNCDGKSGDEYKECFHANVSDELSEAQNDGKIKGASKPDSKFFVPGLIAFVSGMILFTDNDILTGCSTTSTWLLGSAGVTSLLGELLAQHSYKKSTDDLKNKYTARMSEKSSEGESVISSVNENQKIAFEFQIEQEQARKKAHKTRKTTYTIAMGLYAASSIAALSEALFPGTASTCEVTPKNNFLKHAEGFEEYAYLDSIDEHQFHEIILRKLSNIIFPEAHAFPMAGAIMSGMKAVLPEGFIASATSTVKTAIRSAYGRAAFSGVLTNYSRIIASKAGDHAKESDKRITILTELKNSFVGNGGAGFSDCSEAERKNASSPSCFCFTETGEQDPAKVGQKVCKDFLAGAQSILATKYGAKTSSESGGLKGCFSEDKKFDPSCQCKTKTSSADSKKNSCLKFSGKVNLGSLAKITGAKSLVKDSLDFNRGAIDTAKLAGSAGNVNKLIDTIDKKKKSLVNDKKFGPALKEIDALEKKLAAKFSNDVNKGLQDGSLSGADLFGGLPTSSTPPNAKEVLKDFKSKMTAPKFQQGKSAPGSSGQRKLGDYDFGDGGKGDGIDFAEDSNEVMKKEYSFNDINDNSDNNIFKIITNRYHRSGFRILFDDKGTLQPEKANDSEINEK